MKISLAWLRDYVKVDIPVQELVDRMTMIGLVAESVESRADDVVLDVETYANRPDLLGHLGVAREVAAMLGLPLEAPAWPIDELDETTEAVTAVDVKDAGLCPRYCGIVVRGLKVGPSPDWLRRRLEAIGLRPLNNVVDVTNYVLFATGQPIHAFDFGKLAGSRIVVRRARSGETLKDLEGRSLALDTDTLVIADEARPAALAGVIGGEATAVSISTQDVFIESANFDPVSVRLTAKRLGLSTDASYRFERGADPGFPPQAALMAASLLTRMGGKATRGVLDVCPRPAKPRSVILRHARIGELLGVDVPAGLVEDVLPRLGFKVRRSSNNSWRVEVPSFRVDIDREADLVEEVARFYGYDRIPSVPTPARSFEPPSARRRDRVRHLRTVLFGQGFDEVINWSFADPEKESLLGNGRAPVGIRNPLSTRASVLRTSLVMGLLENAAWNLNRGLDGVHIFEVGNVYFLNGETPEERLTLSLLSMGLRPGPGWEGKPAPADFFALKGAVEAVLSALRYEPFSYQPVGHPYFQEGRSVTVLYKGQEAGRLGLLRKATAAAYGLEHDVFAAELDIGPLFKKQPRAFRYVPVPKFPAVSRDLSFLVDASVGFQDIQNVLGRLAPPLLEDYELIDRFSGEALGPGQVSLSIRFRYRHPKRTLLAEEVERVEQEIVSQLKSSLAIQLREGKIDN
jgi:phenylalanyl-tRNA synthetase beta chain